MGAKKKIYRYSLRYRYLSKIAFFFMRIYYKKIHIRGQEHVDLNSPIIFAPNHKNALMDPLLILYAFPGQQMVFMAVSYIFSASKTFRKFLRFLKILPVYRAREGVENLGKNEQPFTEAIETLQHKGRLCLMPEGRQVEKRMLLPLVKGMFRIGLAAQEQFGEEKAVKIVPVGIEYDDLLYSGREVCIQFGEPMEMSDYYRQYTEHAPLAYNAVRRELYPRISRLMLNINSSKHYDSIYLATLLQTGQYLRTHRLNDNAWNRLTAKQNISRQYLTLEQTQPEQLDELEASMQKLYTSGKSADEIYRAMQPIKAGDILLLITLLPLFIPGAVGMFLPYLAIKLLTRKLKENGFYSSVNFVAGIGVPAVFFILYFLVSLFLMPALWAFLLCLVLIPLAGILSFKLKNLYIDTISRLMYKISCTRKKQFK